MVALSAACVVAAVALSGFSPISAAQESVQVECPQGWTPSHDGTQCLSDAVDDNVVTTTSCTQGVLSADGQYCIVPRLDAAPAPLSTEPASGSETNAVPVPVFTG